MLWRDRILTSGGGVYNMLIKTGADTGWSFKRSYGCNSVIGSENLCGSRDWLVPLPRGVATFVKGRMIGRYTLREQPTQGVGRVRWSPPRSTAFARVAWRDVFSAGIAIANA